MADLQPVPALRADLEPATSKDAVEFIIAPAGQPDHSTETIRLHEDTRNHAARLEPGRARSVVLGRAGKRGAIPRAEAPASVVEDFTAAVAEDSTVAAELMVAVDIDS